jgi:hypothetical protein
MLFFQKVQLTEMPNRNDPLYVGHFFPLTGMWWRKRKQRQEMIFSVAITWMRAVKKQMWAPGMIEEEFFLSRLTSQVRDARTIIEFFFNIQRLGFNLGDGVNHGPTIVTPKKLPKKYIEAIEKHLNRIVFSPGPTPTSKHLVKTTVQVRLDIQLEVKQRLRDEDREDLLPVVDWLYRQPQPMDFYYRPAGKLQARDTSVYPVKAIETWPSWLRTALFGTTVDIENAFCQFMLHHLEQKHASNPKLLRLKYPDIIKAAYDKQAFREDICRDVLHLPPHEENISVVKRLIMALANGSNATAGLMTSDSRSTAVALVKQHSPGLMPSEMIKAGDRLSRIATQFRNAKRELCIYFRQKPTRENMKKIFQEYFNWEKEARYKIWDAVGQTGLMLHDGVDGIITEMPADELEDLIQKTTNLRVSVETS